MNDETDFVSTSRLNWPLPFDPRPKKIGSGAFAKVYRVKDKKTGEVYAAKLLKTET